jgi:catechol 2,3-dioxygenase-like lactoylglutathione lyase family enzyme
MPLLDHVAVRVTDLDRAIEFYSNVFGFELIERRMQGQTDIEAAAMKVSEGSIIFLLCSPSFRAHDQSIEGRPEHFCVTFEPAEFEQVMARLKERDVFAKLDCELLARGGATGRSLSKYILDPDNNQIEVKTQ